MKTNKIILKKIKTKNEPETLAGIWENNGFEKIKNLGKEIKDLRKEIDRKILEKY